MSKRGRFFRFSGRYLAILAVFAQVIAPVALAARPGLDIAGFLCAPLETLSQEERALAEALLADLLGEQPDDTSKTGHCAFCVLVHGVPLPEHHVAPPVLVGHEDIPARVRETLVVHPPQGPPLGLRAPPLLSL